MSDTHMRDGVVWWCPYCRHEDEDAISVHAAAYPDGQHAHVCPECGRASQQRVRSALARYERHEQAAYEDHMWHSDD